MTLRIRSSLPSGRSLLAWIAATGVVLAVGGFLVAASGLYNIAASVPHLPPVRWFLQFAMERSVATQSLLDEAEDRRAFDVAGAERLGAAHFHNGCAFCHGAPGVPQDPVTQSMRPAPPALSYEVTEWGDDQLFWIVRHGFKYTGMPAWAAEGRDDEVWAVVAFLRRLPSLDAAGYRDLASGNRTPRDRPASVIESEGTEAAAACARCHDDGEAPPTSGLVPRLAGLSPDYLAQALRHYAEGLRPSGIMQPIAVELSAAEISDVADYYSELPRSGGTGGRAAEPTTAGEDLELGRLLAARGAPEAGLPACLSCHGEKRLARFPLLDGQPAPYLAGQLRLWREGLRDLTPEGRLMAVIARRMSDAQIDATAAYFEARTGEAGR